MSGLVDRSRSECVRSLDKVYLKMIQNIYSNGGNVKVISGDTLLNTAEVCRKAGIANTENAIAINKMSFEQLDLIIDETTVFANASMSQKACIVEQIKKRGHRVAFIGDGDNDTQAMKAANLAIAVEEATESAIMCSHLSAGKEFLYSKEDIVRSRRIYKFWYYQPLLSRWTTKDLFIKANA